MSNSNQNTWIQQNKTLVIILVVAAMFYALFSDNSIGKTMKECFMGLEPDVQIGGPVGISTSSSGETTLDFTEQMKATKEYMSCGSHPKRMERMEGEPTSTPAPAVNYWSTGFNTMGGAAPVDFPVNQKPDMKLGSECAGDNAVFVSSNLLPQAVTGSKPSELQVVTPELVGQQLLDTQQIIGVDTISSSLKNASYDLRAAPRIENTNPFGIHQSSIERTDHPIGLQVH